MKMDVITVAFRRDGIKNSSNNAIYVLCAKCPPNVSYCQSKSLLQTEWGNEPYLKGTRLVGTGDDYDYERLWLWLTVFLVEDAFILLNEYKLNVTRKNTLLEWFHEHVILIHLMETFILCPTCENFAFHVDITCGPCYLLSALFNDDGNLLFSSSYLIIVISRKLTTSFLFIWIRLVLVISM